MPNTSRIYLDHSASTPVDERVLAVMQPYFHQIYGNPSSVHRFGQDADAAVEQARYKIAQVFGCLPKEVVFTSCGSESDNLAIRGAAIAGRQKGRGAHIVTHALEHSAVGRTVAQLAEVFGFEMSHAPVDKYGRVTPGALQSVIRDDTVLVSIIYANNEIGTVNPIAELANVAHAHGTLFHTDAVQAPGQLSLSVDELGVDLLSISGHKFYGPKGVGALYVRQGTPMLPMQTGGSHESGLRSGTHNVPLIVGMAEALSLAEEAHEENVTHYIQLRDAIINGVLQTIPEVELTGCPDNRLPSHASFVFKDVDANNVLMQLDAQGIAASSGSACKTGNPEPSEVIVGLGYDTAWSMGSLRLTVGRQNTAEDVKAVRDTLPTVIETARKLWMPV